MKQITITYDVEDKKITVDNALAAEVIIMLNEALEEFCFELGKPVEQVLAIAYSMQEKGELWEEE